MQDFVAREPSTVGALRTVLDGYLAGPGQFSILWPSSRHLSPKLRVFVDFVCRKAVCLQVKGLSAWVWFSWNGDSRIGAKSMPSRNLSRVVTALRSHGVSDNFIRGALFLIGAAVVPKRDSPIGDDAIVKAQQWLLGRDVNNGISDKIISGTDYARIQLINGEFVYKLGVSWPSRTVHFQGVALLMCEPVDNGILPKIYFPLGDETSSVVLAQFSKLYFEFVEEIGRSLESGDLDFEESHMAGFNYFKAWAEVDYEAFDAFVYLLIQTAPPVLKFFFILPYSPETDASSVLPSQMAINGLLSGLDDSITQYAWAHQSWLFFEDGVEIPGVEELEPVELFDYSCNISAKFYEEYKEKLASLASSTVDLEGCPSWVDDKAGREALLASIPARWGYDPSDQSLGMIERKQLNACMIFTVFCSMCKSARVQ